MKEIITFECPIYNIDLARKLKIDWVNGTVVTLVDDTEEYRSVTRYIGKDVYKSILLEKDQQVSSDTNTGDEAMFEACLGFGYHKISYNDVDINVICQGVGAPVSGNCVDSLIHRTLVLVINTPNMAKFLIDFCEMCVTLYRKIPADTVAINRWDSQSEYWRNERSVSCRPIESVVLPSKVKKDLIDDIDDFVDKETADFYKKHGIPYKRSYLLYGLPGTGKTSMVNALAGRYRRDIYMMNPSDPHMTDDKLKSAFFQASSTKSLVILEDVDSLFSSDRSNKMATKSSVTFSGLLNAMDGIGGGCGLLIFMTTNHEERLDPALTRYGRVDYRVYFESASIEQFEIMFKNFYAGCPTTDADASIFAESLFDLMQKTGSMLTMADLQHYFIQNRKSPIEKARDGISSMLDICKNREDIKKIKEEGDEHKESLSEDMDTDDAQEESKRPRRAMRAMKRIGRA